ncbi:MAG: 23S rRNA (uracil(1939)-C(5))-methyltransferase RlmD [Chloroflexi bacterium]|nr:23S rRNA (uracil(1939)-C(5))-methyltransferase RlmD [Chloroflexota bacterium]
MGERVALHGMAYGGAAVGRLDDGAAVFVHGGLAGETVEVELVERRKRFARGRLVQVLEAAPGRVEAPCPHFREGCGGCQWQHATYDAQLGFRQVILADQLRRFGGIADPLLLDPVRSPEPFGYRVTAELHTRGGRVGFNREGSHQLVDVEHCPLLAEPLDVGLGVVRGFAARLPASVESVQLRLGEGTMQLTLFAQDDPRSLKLLAAELAATCERRLAAAESEIRQCTVAGVRVGSERTRGLVGQPHLFMRLAGRPFRVSAQSFFQVNRGVADQLAAAVTEAARGQARVLDLFSGVGVFGLLLADQADEVVGVEAHPAAIADAEANRAEAAAENVQFVQADVDSAGEIAARAWGAVILDPPRAGCPRAILDALDASRIIYVSCDPSTLARDAKILIGRGYRLTSAQLFDMFPQTYHLETLAIFDR